DLAEAVVPHLVEANEPDGADLLADVRAEIAIDGGPYTVEARKCECDAGDCRHRNDVCERRADREEIKRPGAHLTEHVGRTSERAVGENLDIDATVGRRPNRVACFSRALIDRMSGRQVVPIFQFELTGLRARTP